MLVLKELGAHERQPDHDVLVELRRRVGHAAHAVELAQLLNTHTAVFRHGVSRLQASLPAPTIQMHGGTYLEVDVLPDDLELGQPQRTSRRRDEVEQRHVRRVVVPGVPMGAHGDRGAGERSRADRGMVAPPSRFSRT